MDEGDDEINDCLQIGCTPSIQMPRSKLRLDMQQYVIAREQAGRLKTAKHHHGIISLVLDTFKEEVTPLFHVLSPLSFYLSHTITVIAQ